MANLRAIVFTSIACFLMASCGASSGKRLAAPETGNWVRLFNGRNLEGWTVKIAGHALNDNYGNTFRVKDGVLQVSYDQYDSLGRQFGSIYTQKTYSNYWLHAEYRIVGDQAPGSPGFSYHNSGIEFHSQAPETMTRDQEFPVSLEMNLLAGGVLRTRLTGNVCRNSVRAFVNGKVLAEQCGDTSTVGVRGNTWVTAEAEVHGGESIKFFIDGAQVAEATQLQLDSSDSIGSRMLAAGANPMLQEGRISLQSEGNPVEFRNIELLMLDSH